MSNGFLYNFFWQSGCSQPFISCNHIAVVVVCPSDSFAKGDIIFSDKYAKQVILVATSGTTFLCTLMMLPIESYLYWMLLFKYAVSSKSNRRGRGSSTVAKLDVRNLFFGNLIVAYSVVLPVLLPSESVFGLTVNCNVIRRFVGGSLVSSFGCSHAPFTSVPLSF